jgi:hypothetical protein
VSFDTLINVLTDEALTLGEGHYVSV